MDIDITTLKEMNCFELSHSVMEGGSNAGPLSWQNSLNKAEEITLLDNEEKLQEFRDWLKPFGAWDKEEISAMSDQELNALFLQWVAGDVRETGVDYLEEIDWKETAKQQMEGQISSNIFRADDGKIYFSLDR